MSLLFDLLSLFCYQKMDLLFYTCFYVRCFFKPLAHNVQSLYIITMIMMLMILMVDVVYEYINTYITQL